MKYVVDHDLHIHSQISLCSGDPEQSKERILSYAVENGYKTICVTDHFWDEGVEGASDWYKLQNFNHVAKIKPLPKAEGVRFLFGCETELNKDLVLGLSKDRYNDFDFIIIPTTHFHMLGYTLSEVDGETTQGRINAWIKRFDAVLDMDLPFYKVGFAHLTVSAISRNKEEYFEMLERMPEDELRRLFSKAAQKGAGIELNASDISFADNEADIALRIYRIAKEEGCKFYFGSDAHSPKGFEDRKKLFERAARLLELTEDDKFII